MGLAHVFQNSACCIEYVKKNRIRYMRLYILDQDLDLDPINSDISDIFSSTFYFKLSFLPNVK